MAKRNVFKKSVAENEEKEVITKKKKETKPSDKPVNKGNSNQKRKSQKKISFNPFTLSGRVKVALGLFFILVGLYLVIAFTSYLFTWKADQDLVFQLQENYFSSEDLNIKNTLGKLGAYVSHLFFYKWIGISSFFIPFLSFIIGIHLVAKRKLFTYRKTISYSILCAVLISLILSYLFSNSEFPLGGTFGSENNGWLESLLGKIGAGLLYLFSFIATLFFYLNIDISTWLKKKEQRQEDEVTTNKQEDEQTPENTENHIQTELKEDSISEESEPELDSVVNRYVDAELEIDETPTNNENSNKRNTPNILEEQKSEKKHTLEIEANTEPPLIQEQEKNQGDSTKEDTFEIVQPTQELSRENLSEPLNADVQTLIDEKEVDHFGVETEYDPTLDLRNFDYPKIELLEDHGESNILIDRTELEANKDQIVQTLRNYKIEIAKIKATVGPTVTLYEIVPAPGVRISKIKNLEDDIALSLAALGIRIIAPIPGKGTIGIEVPNTHPNIVSMKSMLSSDKFINAKADLPVAIGKTISNENYIADLAKMPHLLIAGATGQGKSVGINALLVSLLYKKHPSELKFVLVDPKKVELSIYSNIEKHYLAKLPGEEEAIITDTAKVVATLNSLCIEMDERYDLLKDAQCRNIKEYNKKFKQRKLNPEKGHRFLPYIVLVVDEFADLIMTAGKEVESPIARLAQLARAIGIHLIIATQRPSVNIITGIIKANFPARIAFRVMSKVDSRTILDMGGADQLIGRGDLILSIGSDSKRLQCPFVDTPEVEKITQFIGNQESYPTAHLLPDALPDGESGSLDEGEELDRLFADAARLVVQNDSGSTSMLQRRLKLGYNRAGRIMDQLERAGIVGPAKGSKPREVLYFDEVELERYLENLV